MLMLIIIKYHYGNSSNKHPHAAKRTFLLNKLILLSRWRCCWSSSMNIFMKSNIFLVTDADEIIIHCFEELGWYISTSFSLRYLRVHPASAWMIIFRCMLIGHWLLLSHLPVSLHHEPAIIPQNIILPYIDIQFWVILH